MARPAQRVVKIVKNVPRIPKGRRFDDTREEFDRVIDLLNERGQMLNDLRHNLDVQFQRMAQIQAEVDDLKRLLARAAFTGKR
jgi:hypothetical protein